MQEPGGLRLDGELWTPSALGTLGPHGLLRDFAAGGETSYRPLLRSHLAEGQLSDSVRRAVEVIEDREGWDNLANTPEIARFCPPGLSTGRWEDDRTIAVVLRDRVGQQFQGVIVGRFDRFDPQVAHLGTFWVWNAAWLTAPGVHDILAGGWLALFRALAQRGAVAMTAAETWTGRRFVHVLRNIAGFRPTKDVYAERGLSAADSELVLADWRATIENDQVVRFATRPTLNDDAHRDLLTVLNNYFAVVSKAGSASEESTAPLESMPDYRQTLNGEVGIDGARGWGTGPSNDDWFQPPPDQIPDNADWHHRGQAVITRWLQDQTAPDPRD
jgi:hypothetical protein